MTLQVISGAGYFKRGLHMVFQPGLRRFVLIPLLINLVVFTALVYFSVQKFSLWLTDLMAGMPDWLGFLQYLVWPVFILALLLAIFFTFTLMANLIAAPFNSVLSEKVEIIARGGTDHFPPMGMNDFLALVPRTVLRELRKAAYFIPRSVILLILSFIPVLNLVVTPLWVLFTIWMIAIQYVDYPSDNNNLDWKDTLGWVRARRAASLSFGGLAYVSLMVPLFNLIAMPAAIAGATLMWVEKESVDRK